jgi:hypothetical protein
MYLIDRIEGGSILQALQKRRKWWTVRASFGLGVQNGRTQHKNTNQTSGSENTTIIMQGDLAHSI